MDNIRIAYIKSERGKNKYIYKLKKPGLNNKFIWKCENYQKMKFKGRLQILTTMSSKNQQVHNQVLDSGKFVVGKAINELIKKKKTNNLI